MLPKFDLILLDADGTLFDYDRAETMALAKLFDVHQFTYGPEVLARYREINGAVWADFEQGRMSKQELQSTRFERLLAAFGLTGDGATFNSEYLDYLGEGSFLLPGAEEVCRELSKQCKLVIATNGIAKTQRKRLSLSPIKDFIDCIVVSEETGYQKPQTGFFEYAFNLCGHTERSRALMVGDSLTADIAGGKAFGIATCWYNPYSKPVAPEYRADHEVSELKELLPIILD